MILSTSMAKSISKSKKSRGGRPKTYRTPILVRMGKGNLAELDAMRKAIKATRPEAIRQIVEAFFSQI